MDAGAQGKRWFWATLVLSSISIVAVVFAFWELVENHYFRDLNYLSLHYLYISRGIASSLLLATWAAWFVLRQRRAAEEELRRSRERYRGLLEASPDAVVLYDAALRVCEWNAAAERLYGLAKNDVIAQLLPTVPADREIELESFLQTVSDGGEVLNQETVRMNRRGERIDVQLSLLPFREASRHYFLEVTSDIRERVRMRQTLIELEKLTSMGKMAAGTAHHLNTPLASMLLRIQMMREKSALNGMGHELAQLESTVGFCQQFVRRLLDFSRRPAHDRKPETLGPVVDAVLGFLSPSFNAKHIRVLAELDSGGDRQILADRNELETLLLILLSNAVDAVSEHGTIAIRCTAPDSGQVALEIADDGCGISEQDARRIFEPFFTTKPPGKGTGLGLAIARNIVAEHGGSIGLRAAAGQGAVATVRLPLLQSTQAKESV